MERKAVSGIMLTLLLVSMLTLALDVQSVKTEDMLLEENDTKDVADGIARAEEGPKSQLVFEFPSPVVTRGPVYDSITMSGSSRYGAPGEPILPFKIVKALIPQGEDVQSVDVTTGNRKVLEGSFNVEYGKTPIPISSNATFEDQPNQAIYSSSNPFPEVLFSQMSEQHLRGYKILTLKLHPVQYTPKTGKLSYFETVTVTINIEETDTESLFFRDLPQDRAFVLGIVDNPDKMKTYTKTVARMQPTTFVNSSFSYDYVVITNNALSSAFQPLIDWKIQKGLNATIVLVEDIMNDPDYHCDGLFGDGCAHTQFNDTQAHIRNFIKDAYLNWGTEYVLLGGDDEVIPSRGVYVSVGSYTDYSIPCDMYYGALDGSWDNDNDTIFGEAVYYWSGPENGTAGEEADFFAEVYIGRATVDTPEETTNFVSKTLAYEQNTNATYLKKALMIGQTLDSITEGGNGKDLVTDIIPQYTTTRLYERDGTFSRTAVINEMNNGTHIVNHDGHAGYSGVMGLSRSDVDSLTNTEYFMAYSIGCYSAAFDEATSGSNEAIAEHFIFNSHGAFAYIGNSRYGWYSPGSTNGPGDRYDRSFFNVLRDGIRNVGKALQLSKENLFDEYMHRWTYFTLNLLGDPETEIVTAIKAPTAHFETRTDLLTPPRYEGIVSLNGTAKRGPTVGATFDNYTIEFGLGTTPSSWSSTGISLTNNGETEIINGTLATWDTSLVSDGTYTLRSTVSDVDGNVGKDWAVIIVDNAYITSPPDHDFFRVGVNITIVGTASGTNFQSYSVEYALTSDPTNWTLILSSTTPVVNGVLGVWHTSSIASADYYTVGLTVNNVGGYSSTDNITLVLDPDFQVGWPQKVPHRFVAASVGVGDIDDDDYFEIVAGESRIGSPYGRNVYAWHYDGTNVTGWPQVYVASQYIRSSPALVDIDGDGDKEIFVGTGWSRVEAWHHDGSTVANWPVYASGEAYTAIAIGDLDNDGDIEIVAGSLDHRVYAWHHDGSLVDGWPVMTGSTIISSPALGDIDGDGRLEVVVGSSDSYIYAWHCDGTNVTGWPKMTGGWVWSSPALGDIDGDGDLEVVVGSGDGYLYVLHHDGTDLDGWPKATGSGIDSSPALGDIDGDGDLEIVVSLWSNVYAWHHDGTNVAGWPVEAYGVGDSSPVLGDIDGDGDIEILISSDGYTDKIYAFHHDGSSVSGWPKITPTFSPTGWHSIKRSTPILADIDKDGDIEVILGDEGLLLVWDLNGTYRPEKMEWPMFHHDERHTGLYVPPEYLRHDVTVTLEAPDFLKPSDSSLLNATVRNRGFENETNVELQLLINGSIVDSVVIPELLSGSSYTLSYLWTPTIGGIHNVTAYVTPVPGENVTANNLMSKMVHVRYVEVALISEYSELLAITSILDTMGIGYDIYNDNYMYLYTEDFNLLRGYPTVVLYRSWRDLTSNECSALESYLSYGGNLLVTGFDCLVWDPLLADLVRSSTYGDNMGEPDLYVVDASHPIMNGSYGSFPTGYHISGLYSDCDAAEADTTRNAVTVAELADGYDKIIATELSSGKVVFWNGRGDNDWTWNVDCEAMFKNILVWFRVRYEHELTVSLEAPLWLMSGGSSLLNATVYNRGLNNETSVELQLLINGGIVNSTTIPELLTDSFYTLSYLWITPTVEATYNVTAYALPVSGENNTLNNWVSANVIVSRNPIHFGDLIIDDNQTFIIENVTFTQIGNVYVRDNALLIIRNAELRLNQTSSYQYIIQVDGSATLQTENASITSQYWFYTYIRESAMAHIGSTIIRYIDSQYPIGYFCAYDNSIVSIRNSTLYRVYAYSYSNISIYNSIINYMSAYGGSSVFIYNSTIHWDLYLSDSSFVSFRNSTVGYPRLSFRDSHNATLHDLHPGFNEYWNIYVNGTVEGIGYNLTLWNTEITWGWNLDCYDNSNVSLYDSTIHYLYAGWYNPTVSVYNSTIEYLSVYGYSVTSAFNSIINYIDSWYFRGALSFDEAILSGGWHIYESQFFISGDISFTEGIYTYWSDSNVTRNYNIICLYDEGHPIVGAELMLYDQNGTLIWTGFTNSNGQANFNLTFTDSNYTAVSKLEASGGGSFTIRYVKMLSDTPIILILPDVIPPTVSILSPEPGAIIASTNVTVEWTGADNDTGINYYLVYLNGELLVNTTDTSCKLIGLAEGFPPHNVIVVAYDKAGNLASDLVCFIVDATAPSVEIISPEDGSMTKETNVTIVWTGSDGETRITYYLIYLNDDQVLNTTSTSHELTGLTEGNHRIKIEAYDLAGNTDNDEITITLDNTAPIASINAPANDSYLKDMVTINITGYDVNLDKIELYISGELKQTWNTSGFQTYSWNTLTYVDGLFSVKLTVYDKAGNLNSASINVTVDNTAPSIVLISPENDTIVAGNVTIDFYILDFNLQNVAYAINKGLPVDITGKTSFTIDTNTLDNGSNEITITATDKSGNSMFRTLTVVIDNINPSVSARVHPQRVSEGTSVSFDAGNSTDNVGIIDYEWDFGDGNKGIGIATSHIYANVGIYKITLTVKDAAGNIAKDTFTITVLLDTDGDGTPDTTDLDDDNDGVDDADDVFPLDPTETIDTDEDGIGNNADTDDDNDGVLDIVDAFPLDPTESIDTDNDGVGDNADTDDDNDGMPDTWETDNGLDPLDAADASLDPDGDGLTNLQEYQGGTDPNVSDVEAFPWWILGAVAAVIIGIAVAATFFWRRRK